MKIFIGVFIISFTLLLSAYYGLGYYQILEEEKMEREMAAYERKHRQGQQSSPDDFSLPDARQEPALPVTEVRTRVRRPARADGVSKPIDAASGKSFNTMTVTSSDGVAKTKVAARPVPPENDVVLDANAVRELGTMKYEFTRPSFLDAVSRDDAQAVSLFLKAGMHTEFNQIFIYEPADSSIFRFYASPPAQLYNPLSLAVVAEAHQSLPLLIAGTRDLQTVNLLTAEHRVEPDRATYDLLALAVKTDNLQLLRQFTDAGLKPVLQNYLLVAMYRSNNKLPPGIDAEEKQKFLRKKADMLVELINNGQNVKQRLPIPIPIPCAMEMFFIMAGKTIRSEVISRVNDEEARKQLQAIADKLEKKSQK